MVLHKLFFILLLSFQLQAKQIVIYVNSHLDKEQTTKRWQPTIDYLNNTIQKHQFTLLPIKPTEVEHIKNFLEQKKIDFLITQPAITSELQHTHNITPILTMANKYHMDQFGSVFITTKQSKINRLEDLKHKHIAAVAPLGFGGWLIGYNELLEVGIDPLKDGMVTFTGNQQKVIEAILRNKYDVGIIRTGMLEKISKQIDTSNLKVINAQETPYDIVISSKLYPEWSLSKAEHVDIHLANTVFKAFNILTPEHNASIAGEYYHWHLPQNHKEVDSLFKRLKLSPYKGMAQYDLNFVISVVLITVVVMFFLAIATFFYLKYRYTQSLKNSLEQDVLNKNTQIQGLHKKLYYAADKALAGYWEWNLDTDTLHVSENWYKHLGYSKKQISNNSSAFFSLLHPDDAPRVQKNVQNYLNKKTNKFSVQFRMKHAKGHYIWINGMGIIDNNIFYGFHIDIDDLINTKELLIAQSKSATMGEMISLISHQWKQPLSVLSMVGNNLTLDIALENVDNKVLQGYAEDIDQQTQYLSKTIDTFRSFFHPQKKKELHHIEDVIEGALAITASSFANNNIKIYKEYDNTPLIAIDKYEFMQIVLNIINNAKDALKQNSNERKITIRTYINSMLIIEIEDNAGGISPEELDKIFNAYYTTKGDAGTGLGLYIVKIILEEHLDGAISVSNTEHGAKFTIELPL